MSALTLEPMRIGLMIVIFSIGCQDTWNGPTDDQPRKVGQLCIAESPLVETCAVQYGVCWGWSKPVCVDGKVVCTGTTDPRTAERCNGIDDDCDGTVDEAFPLIDEPCRVGEGICAAKGTYTCAPSGDVAICSVTPSAPTADATCNDRDEDPACAEVPLVRPFAGPVWGLPDDDALSWVLVEPFEYVRGLDLDGADPVWDAFYGPPHAVQLTEAFAVASIEVTIAQWMAVTGNDTHPGQTKDCPQCPVDYVSWYEAVEFANRLTEMQPPELGLTPCYAMPDGCVAEDAFGEACQDMGACHGAFFCPQVFWIRECTGYRLPTEAEWEGIARGGSDTLYWWGDDATEVMTHENCGHRQGASAEPVATQQHNPFGLYDMLGNVAEWVFDIPVDYPTEGEALVAPVNPAEEGTPDERDERLRLVRGGFAGAGARACRAPNRNYAYQSQKAALLGLRLVRSMPNLPHTEQCNGIDNDCDGLIDEGVSELCNGVDDDCDGQIDEAYPTLGETCQTGVGICAGDGRYVCGAGDVICSYTPPAGAESDQICNSVDDDCDGRVDEDPPCGGRPVGVPIAGPLYDTDEVPIDWVVIEPHVYRRGFDRNHPDYIPFFDDIDGPAHTVQLTRTFAISPTEVTIEQWAAVTGTYPSFVQDCPTCPVERVSWYEAVEFANRLTRLQPGLTLCYEMPEPALNPETFGRPCDGSACDGDYIYPQVFWNRECTGYRLPTEAEWEAAARGGQDGLFWWPNEDDPVTTHENCDGPVWDSTRPVAEGALNPFGLHHMLGNVMEWVYDMPDDYDVPDEEPWVDPVNPPVEAPDERRARTRLSRGGFVSSNRAGCRVTSRSFAGERRKVMSRGLRLVRTLTF